MNRNRQTNRGLQVETLDQRAVPALLGIGVDLAVTAEIEVGKVVTVEADVEATAVVAVDAGNVDDLLGTLIIENDSVMGQITNEVFDRLPFTLFGEPDPRR